MVTHRRSKLLLPRHLPLIGILIAYAASVTGDMITSIVLPWFVLELTGDAAATGLIAFVSAIPAVIGMFFGGVYVDRVGRRQASIISAVVNCLSIAAIPILDAGVGLQFWHLLVLAFIGTLLDAPGLTARESLLPEVARLARVPLSRLNTITETIQGLSLLIGPAIAGLLIAAVGSVNTLWFTVALLLVAVVASVALLPPRLGRAIANPHESYWASLKQGLSFVAGDRTIRELVILLTALILIMAPLMSVILPVFVQQHYGSAMNLGLLISFYGIGSIIGMVGYGAVGARLSQYGMLIVSILALTLTFSIFAIAPSFHLVLAISAIGGILGAPFNPIVNTLLQQRAPAELRGRILGTVNGLSLVAAPAGLLIAGLLLEVFTTQIAIAALALGTAIIAVWVAFNPILQTLEKP